MTSSTVPNPTTPSSTLFGAKACATTPITLSTPQTVDGVALVAGDVCLATAQGTVSANGLWVVQAAGWTRPAVAPSGVTLPVGYLVEVGLGTSLGIGLWQSTNGTPIVVDTTNQFFGRPSIPAASVVGAKSPTITAKATDFTTTLPLPQTLLSGTFTATATSHLCEVQTDGAVAGFADGNLGLVFGVAGSPGGTLRGAGQYWPLISGATYKPIGKVGISGFGGSVSRRIWITGLTPGTVYTWKLEAVIVGGYTAIDLTPDSPTAICLSADQLRAYTVCYSSGKVYELLLGGRSGWEYRQEVWGIARGWTSSLGASITGIGCTPTTERLVVMQYDGGGSRTLILDAVTGATLFTTTCPAGATQPYSVVVRSDTEAWISCGSGHIYVVNPSTGANVGAAVLVDATGCRGICLSGDNATVYTATANGKIAKYPTAGGSVTAVATGSSVGWAVAWGGDRVWCSTDTNKAVRSHNASTLAVIDTIDFTASPMSGHGVPLYIALTSDWKLLSVVTSTGYWDYFSTDKSGSDYPANSIFDYPNISTYGGGVVHTSDSYILATAGTKLNYWPGATYQCRVQGGDGAGGITAEFYNEFAEVAFL